MKKWSSWRQRQYVDNYLLNLETQGEKFHVINVSWFSMKAYHKFCSFNICSHFLQVVFMKALNTLFSTCLTKISSYPSHSLSMYDIFNGENSKLSTSTMFMLAQADFLWCIEVSVPKNIMTLILETVIWDYSWGKVRL